MSSSDFLQRYPIISDQVDARELRVILLLLERQLDKQLSGSIVEFGCYTGTTSLFIRRVMNAFKWYGEFHVYDSFAGLPKKTTHDESPAGLQFQAGTLRASKRDFIHNFKKANLALPTIHKGWFSEVTPDDVPEMIVFAFLDGDYFESVRDSLTAITPKLAPGAIIVVDDYANEALPGAARAVDQWRQTHRCRFRVEASLAIIEMI